MLEGTIFSGSLPDTIPLTDSYTYITAEKAYRQALQTLSSIPSFPVPQSPSPLLGSDPLLQTNPLLASLFPNQQGPIASIIRIIYKLRQQSWVPSFLRPLFGLGLGKDGRGRREEEIKGRAVKVLDLLEHAAELGHTDALYKIAQVSSVRLHSFLGLM